MNCKVLIFIDREAKGDNTFGSIRPPVRLSVCLSFCLHSPVCTKYRDHTSNASAVRALTDRQTDTDTDGTVSITSNVDAVGKKLNMEWTMRCEMMKQYYERRQINQNQSL